MEMIQTLNAQLAMMILFTLLPMLGMIQARRTQRSMITCNMPENDNAQRTGGTQHE